MKKIQDIWNRTKEMFDKLGEHPTYDWYFSLACLGLLFIAAAGLSTYFYFALAVNPAVPAIAPTDATPTFDRAAFDSSIKSVHQTDLDAKAIPSSVLKDPSSR